MSDDERTVPPDFNQCQTMRPSCWPEMPSFMMFGPVTYTRCTNVPTWIASDGKGSMTLCDECIEVMRKVMSDVEVRRLGGKT